MNGFAVFLFLLVFGAICWLRTQVPWLKHLHGDIDVSIGRCQLVIPLATCIIASVIVTIILLYLGKKS